MRISHGRSVRGQARPVHRNRHTTPVSALLDEAGRHYGVFEAATAERLGVTRGKLRTLVRHGVIGHAAPQLYLVRGAPDSWLQRVTAATLLAPHALAARRTAVALHRVRGRPRHGRPHIVIPHGTTLTSGELDVVVHRSRTLEPVDHTTVGGIPSCTVERALVDEGSVDLREWKDLAARALRDHGATQASLRAQLERAGRLRNRRRMVQLVSSLDPATHRAREVSELRFLDLILEAGLPRPIVNYEVIDETGRVIDEIDFGWPQWREGWEVDSREWHTSPTQMARDQMKDLRLAGRGWEIHRVPFELIVRNPKWVQQQVAASLQRAAARYGDTF